MAGHFPLNLSQTNLAGAALNAGGGSGGGGVLGGIFEDGRFFGKGTQVITTLSDGTSIQSGNPGFLQEGGALSTGLGALKTLGSLWNSFQQQKLAKKSFALQTRAFETNLANQTKSYNTELEDRINARYATEGRLGDVPAYLEKNRL